MLKPDIATAFILWPKRQEWQLRRSAADVSRPKNAANHVVVIPHDFIEWAHVTHFVKYTNDEFVGFAQRYFAASPNLLTWWASALSLRGISVDADESGWYVAEGPCALTRWRDAIRRLDQDALAAAALVNEGKSDQAKTNTLFATWMRPRCSDAATETLNKGLWDQHIHFTGTISIPDLWLELVHRPADRLERVARYSETEIDQLKAGSTSREERVAERTRVQEAIAWRRTQSLGSKSKSCVKNCLERGTVGVRDSESFLSYEKRAGEREFLIAAWEKTKKLLTRQTIGADDVWMRNFDRYLNAKSQFINGCVQFPGTPPGLVRFKSDFFDAPKTFGERRNRFYTPTERVVRNDIAVRLTHLREEPSVRGVELRIGPKETANEYYKLGQQLDQVLKPIQDADDKESLEVRLGVHFKRQVSANRTSRTASSDIAHRMARLEVAKASSTFAWYLAKDFERTRNDSKAAPCRFTSIDVASMEAGTTPVDVFAPYMRLLTGCANTLEAIKKDTEDSLFFGHWRRIAEREEFSHWWKSGKKPCVTYHAGEDFLHPLCGLRAISDAVTHCNMKPGDRIGHALALGLDIAAFNEVSGTILAMPQGWLLDDLVWLSTVVRSRSVIANKVHMLAEEIAQDIFGKAISLRALEKLQALRFEPQTEANQLRWQASKDLSAQCRWRELCDESVEIRRGELRELTRPSADFMLSSDFVALVERAQVAVCQQLRQREIVVEANPSSNLAVGRHSEMRLHPYFRLEEKQFQRPDYTFNTDNPGVCGTSLVIEYLQMFDAMIERGKPSKEALKQLAEARAVAQKTFFRGQR